MRACVWKFACFVVLPWYRFHHCLSVCQSTAFFISLKSVIVPHSWQLVAAFNMHNGSSSPSSSLKSGKFFLRLFILFIYRYDKKFGLGYYFWEFRLDVLLFSFPFYFYYWVYAHRRQWWLASSFFFFYAIVFLSHVSGGGGGVPVASLLLRSWGTWENRGLAIGTRERERERTLSRDSRSF